MPSPSPFKGMLGKIMPPAQPDSAPTEESVRFDVDSGMMPEIKGWKTGSTYQLSVRLVSKTEDNDGEVSGTFEVVPTADQQEQEADQNEDAGEGTDETANNPEYEQ